MRDVLRRMKADRFEDIIALVALYRPGPMDNIPKYVKVKLGEEKPDYLHPSLQPVLEETFGIMIYQEQVMQVAQILAGYSLGGADLLRRAMGKKIQSEMDAQKKTFVDGSVARGVKPAQASMIFDQVNKFAGYGFNKSHAAAYALVAYQTAYFKANYPVAFLAASMTLDLGNTDKLNAFRQELDRIGIRLLPPDINRSGAVFTVEPVDDGRHAIRYALGAIKGVGAEAMRALVAEREASGPFKDVFDVSRRVDPRVMNKRQWENLIRAGAFDRLDPNRARLHAAVDLLVRHGSARAEERSQGQSNLFGGAGGAGLDTPPLPPVADWDMMERLKQEFEAIGFYLSAHPLDSFNTIRVGAVPSSGLADRLRRGATAFKMAGVVMSKREMSTRSGGRMAFVMLSDSAGVFEVTLFSEVLASSRHLLGGGTPLLLSLEAQPNGDNPRLTCQRLEPLDEAVARAGVGLTVFLDEAKAAAPLASTLDREGSGRGRVNIMVPIGGGREVELVLPKGYAISAKGRAALRSIPGIVDVREV